jgi:uncharacterized protein with gpF-like domain
MELEIKDKELKNITINDDIIMKDSDEFEYTKEDLTEDGLFTIQTHLRKLSFLDEKLKQKQKLKDKEKEYKNNMTKKVICCSLVKMGKHSLTNTYHLKDKERKTLQEIMHTYNGKSEDEINKEFFDVCKDEIFDTKFDYSKTPIYNV